MNKLILIFSLAGFLCNAQKETKPNVFTNAGDAAKVAVAKQKLYAGDYQGALSVLREVEKNNPDNGTVNFLMGDCYLNLKQNENAKKSLSKAVIAKTVVPESHLLLGRVWQLEENFDKAIAEFEVYIITAGAVKEGLEDGNVYLSQCKNAKIFMAHPIDVTVSNMGAAINSTWDDKNPCITADGKTLIFTTRRPETTSSDVDVNGDGKYFEDIYESHYDEGSAGFANAIHIGAPINIKAHDAATSISADGKQLFIYYNDLRDKKRRAGNVFVSKNANGKWKLPEDLGKPINTSYWEGGASMSADGKRYFFTSERPGGYGRSDIWMVEKLGKTGWSEPVNLGADINSAEDEAGVIIAPDGKTLFFCSNSAASMGGYDIFRSIFENGKWSKPENIGYPINSPANEGQLAISADAKIAYFSSNRAGGAGETDIYKADLNNYSIVEKGGIKKNSNGLGILKGVMREGGEGYGVPEVAVVVKDQSGQVVGSTTTNEIGEYFLTLPAGKYDVEYTKKGYQTITEKLEMPFNEKETPQIEKGFLLKKQ